MTKREPSAQFVNGLQQLVLTLEMMARHRSGVLPYVRRNYRNKRKAWIAEYRANGSNNGKDTDELNTALRAAVRDELEDKIAAAEPKFTWSDDRIDRYAPRRTDRGARFAR